MQGFCGRVGLVLIPEQEKVKNAMISLSLDLVPKSTSRPSADTAFLLVFFISVFVLEALQRGGNDSEIKCGFLYLL